MNAAVPMPLVYLGVLSWLPAPLLLEFVTVLVPLVDCIVSEPVCVPERFSIPPWSSLLQPTNAAATLTRIKYFFICPLLVFRFVLSRKARHRRFCSHRPPRARTAPFEWRSGAWTEPA